MIFAVSGLIVFFGVVLPALIAILVARKHKAATAAAAELADGPSDRNQLKPGEVADVYFETFGHPIPPLKAIDEALNEESLDELPAGYSWEFLVEDDVHPRGDSYVRLTANIVNILTPNPDDRVFDSYSMDLTWQLPPVPEVNNPGILWSTFYRNHGAEWVMSSKIVHPFIRWATPQVDRLKYQVSVTPVRGYYFKQADNQ